MRDAIGGSMLLYIVIFFVSVVMLFFISILSYAKAYRVKNRIINIVEGYNFPDDFNEEKRKELIELIDTDMTNIGYNTVHNKNCQNDSNYGANCNDINVIANNGGVYDYCLCRINVSQDDEKRGYYYEVITYTQFNFPIINQVISSSVHGETKVLGKEYSDWE